jgi:hypothetical protein
VLNIDVMLVDNPVLQREVDASVHLFLSLIPKVLIYYPGIAPNEIGFNLPIGNVFCE